MTHIHAIYIQYLKLYITITSKQNNRTTPLNTPTSAFRHSRPTVAQYTQTDSHMEYSTQHVGKQNVVTHRIAD
jgi:hypothetical protein